MWFRVGMCVFVRKNYTDCLGGVNWCLLSFFVSVCVGTFWANNPNTLGLCLIYISHSTQLLPDNMKKASARCWPLRWMQNQNDNSYRPVTVCQFPVLTSVAGLAFTLSYTLFACKNSSHIIIKSFKGVFMRKK